MRILYLQPSYVPPPTDVEMDRFFLLSEHLEGDILQPIWTAKAEDVENLYGPGSYPVFTRGRFGYHWLLEWPHRGLRTDLAVFRFFLRKGLALHREKRYDCIVVYSHLAPALVGGLLKLFTGAKLIVEVVTTPRLSFLNNRPRPTLKDRVGKFYSDACLYLSMLIGDRVHLLYETQLAGYKLLRHPPATVFQDFVPVSAVQRSEEVERTVLLVGAPWYLKGVDRLIEAFLRLAGDFPDTKLKIQGHFPDPAALVALGNGSAQIEILKPANHVETLKRIGRSWVFVLPSRCEGVPRVMLEAMSAGVPVIGSDAGGIPACIRDGEYGFVVHEGDSDELETRLRQILSDAELRERFAARAYEVAHQEFNEQVYAARFTKMVRAAVEGSA
jgi:glycosyltransferase involved in cell wall biosynthesis